MDYSFIWPLAPAAAAAATHQSHFYLFIKAYSCCREKREREREKRSGVISASNKETVTDIYPAELRADHKFNFAEQTPPCSAVCVRHSVCRCIKAVSTGR